MSSDGNFLLCWDLHEETRTSTLKPLWNNRDFLDVTIACDDDQIEAHKVILSAASPFFQNILKRNPHSHPLLYLRGTLKKDVLSLLDFIYTGETEVLEADLNGFMALANSLEVKGLIGDISTPKQTQLITKTEDQIGKINLFNQLNSGNKQLLEEENYKIVEKNEERQIIHDMKKKKDLQYVDLHEETENIISEEKQLKPERKKKKEVKPEEDFQIVELTEETENLISEDNDSFQDAPKTSMTEYNARKSEFLTRTDNGSWTCTECTYVSKHRGHLFEHVETHIKGFSLECRNCEKTFRMNKSRRLHKYKCAAGNVGKNLSF